MRCKQSEELDCLRVSIVVKHIFHAFLSMTRRAIVSLLVSVKSFACQPIVQPEMYHVISTSFIQESCASFGLGDTS